MYRDMVKSSIQPCLKRGLESLNNLKAIFGIDSLVRFRAEACWLVPSLCIHLQLSPPTMTPRIGRQLSLLEDFLNVQTLPHPFVKEACSRNQRSGRRTRMTLCSHFTSCLRSRGPAIPGTVPGTCHSDGPALAGRSPGPS